MDAFHGAIEPLCHATAYLDDELEFPQCASVKLFLGARARTPARARATARPLRAPSTPSRYTLRLHAPRLPLTLAPNPGSPRPPPRRAAVVAIYIIGFAAVRFYYGPPLNVPRAEDQILRYKEDEPLPSSTPAAKSSSVRAADRSGLKQRR